MPLFFCYPASSMDIFIPSLISFVFVYLLFNFVKSFEKASNTNLPPGPWKLPIIGSMHHLLSTLPHQALRDLATKYGHVMHLQLGEISTIVISSPRAAKEVLRTHDIVLANRPELTSAQILLYNSLDIGFAPYGDYWRKMRRICVSELLGPKSIRAFRSIREDEVSCLVYSIKSSIGLPINLSKKIVEFTSNVTSRAAFGKQLKSNSEILDLLRKISSLVGGFQVADLFPSSNFLQLVTSNRSKSMKIHQEFDNILNNIISEHKKAMENDGLVDDCKDENQNLLDVLLRLDKRGGLQVPDPITSIKAVILAMFLGGTETTAATVEWAIAEMMKHPKVMERAQAELRSKVGSNDYINMVIKETLRLHPPLALLLPRQNNGEAITIDGYNVPSKSRVIVNAWAINRDSEYWFECEKFMPERFNSSGDDYVGKEFEYIPFGGGRRICPGIEFGTVSAQICLAQLLYHFDWKLPQGKVSQTIDMSEAFGTSVRLKNNLILIPTKHHSS